MTRIFISHRHSDEPIASALVDFLLAALALRPDDIRCTSLPGHQLRFGTSISEQLKKDLNVTIGLIALITKDSLLSTWVLFELGSGWATNKLVIPILGPGLTYDDLPGPLKQFPGVQIENDNAFYLMTDVINQLASTLNIQQEVNPRQEVMRNQFITQLREWKSQIKEPESSQLEVVEQFKKQLEDRENAHNKQLQEIESTYQLQKQELVEAQQKEIQEIKQSYQSQTEKLEQSLKSKIKQLEQQLEAEQAQGTKVAAKLQSTQQELSNKELLINKLQQPIDDRENSPNSAQVTVKIELKSERGVDYTNLEQLLDQGKWKDADEETGKLMLQVIEKNDWWEIRSSDIDNFPCEDLRTIDHLWFKYSQGKFGFSIQTNIFIDVLITNNDRNLFDIVTNQKKIWDTFCDRVGWRKGGEYLKREQLTFELFSPPLGHLPNFWGGQMGASLAQRLVTCNAMVD